jgi:hypothetical protein
VAEEGGEGGKRAGIAELEGVLAVEDAEGFGVDLLTDAGKGEV